MAQSFLPASFPAKRHIRKSHAYLRDQFFDGTAPKYLYVSKIGFAAEIVREYPPSVVYKIESAIPWLQMSDVALYRRVTNKLQRHAFALTDLRIHTAYPEPVLYSEGVVVSMHALSKGVSSLRFRNADCTTLLFVHEGRGKIITDFGVMRFIQGDFVVLPCGITYRVCTSRETFLLTYDFPQPLMRAEYPGISGYPIDEQQILAPTPDLYPDPEDERIDTTSIWWVYVKHLDGSTSRIAYPFPPFDAVAWQGNVYPCVVHIKDIRPIESPQFHIDPDARTIFTTPDRSASVQVFKPRNVHSLPYCHLAETHEVLFNHSGYSARPEIKNGSATLHPRGTYHGPDMEVSIAEQNAPRAFPWREETAVLLEASASFVPLRAIRAVEYATYELSWWKQWQNNIKTAKEVKK